MNDLAPLFEREGWDSEKSDPIVEGILAARRPPENYGRRERSSRPLVVLMILLVVGFLVAVYLAAPQFVRQSEFLGSQAEQNVEREGLATDVVKLQKQVNQLVRRPSPLSLEDVENQIGPLEQQIGALRRGLRDVKDTADVAYNQSARNADMIGQHDKVLRDHARRLNETEATVHGLEGSEAAQVTWACANMERDGVSSNAVLVAVAKRYGVTSAELCTQLKQPF